MHNERQNYGPDCRFRGTGDPSFEDRGKKFTLMVAIGKDATPQRTAEVYAVLDTLRVS